MNRMLLAAQALACVASAALATEIGEVGHNAVTVPWGDWLVAVAQSSVQVVLPIVIPILAGYLIAAIRKVYPWAALFLTQRRIEMLIQNGADYGLNAVRGAAKGRKLSFDVGSEVIAQGTQYVIANGPRRVVEAAGGADGIARRIFRHLDLDEAANAGNTLSPALAQVAPKRDAP